MMTYTEFKIDIVNRPYNWGAEMLRFARKHPWLAYRFNCYVTKRKHDWFNGKITKLDELIVAMSDRFIV